MDEVKTDVEVRTPYLFEYWVGALAIFGCFVALLMLNGTLGMREDAKYTIEQIGIMGCAFGGVVGTMYLDLLVKISTLADKPKSIVRLTIGCMTLVFVFLLLDGLKRDDVETWEIAVMLVGAIALIAVYIYFLEVYKGGKYGKRFEDWCKKKDDCNRKKNRARVIQLTLNTANGIDNAGYAEIVGPRAMRINVRQMTAFVSCAFIIMSIIIGVGIAVAHSLDDWTFVFFGCFFVAVILYRYCIHEWIDSAVRKGNMPYEEGVKCAVFCMLAFDLLCVMLSTLVTLMADDGECWDIWDYLGIIPLFLATFIVTYLFCTIGNKRNGHVGALFNVDGFDSLFNRTNTKIYKEVSIPTDDSVSADDVIANDGKVYKERDRK